ncbi:hypothetical protein SUGI_1056030 [Cryptomeria japonica]|nr:hypothetical protein SUGI_1056030 [Cryptomeria japonica]
METHLNYIGKDIWDVTKNGYTTPTQSQPTPPNLTKDEENDCKVREALLRDSTVKIAKLESFWDRYEHLKMEEDARISAFMERVNEIVLGIKCCGGNLSEDEIISKVLRGLPSAYKIKVTSINELRTMPNTSVTRDTLTGRLSAFEIEEFGLVASIKIDLAFKESTSSAPSFDKSDWKAFYAREL